MSSVVAAILATGIAAAAAAAVQDLY